MERLLNKYLADATALKSGSPTVEYLADLLHVSSYYLSDMLRSLTGQSTQQHIHTKMLEKEKEYLSTTKLSRRLDPLPVGL